MILPQPQVEYAEVVEVVLWVHLLAFLIHCVSFRLLVDLLN